MLSFLRRVSKVIFFVNAEEVRNALFVIDRDNIGLLNWVCFPIKLLFFVVAFSSNI